MNRGRTINGNAKMACRLGRQEQTILCRHNDVNHLNAVLRDLRSREQRVQRSNIFVAVESVYSMDGDLAPLSDILRVCGEHAASVIVDEAHG